MPRIFTSKHQKIGEIGEHIAEKYLKSKGFKIIERNYTRQSGEIDIIAQKGEILHFVEVKTVTSETGISPEENMHEWKIKRLLATIHIYLSHCSLSYKDWQLDLVSVFLDDKKKKAKVRMLEEIA